MKKNKPIVGITLGDPGSIGPEIVLKSIINKNNSMYDMCYPLVIGDLQLVEYNINKLFKNDSITINLLKEDELDNEDNYDKGNTINLLDLNNTNMNKLTIGEISSHNGQVSFEFIKKSIELGIDNKIDSVATAPINKEALKAAKINYIGHTEMYSDFLEKDINKTITMFEVGELRTFFLTRHVSLLQAISSISQTKIVDMMQAGFEALNSLGIKEPKVVVAALNPHAGESGLFGKEEIEHIIPAIDKLKDRGLNVEGPIGADSVYHFALRNNYDAVLSLYHDQGHIASKMYDFNKTISMTLGLPFLRTSVDHGTAFDLAYKNQAEYLSMYEAIKKAAIYGPKVRSFHNS